MKFLMNILCYSIKSTLVQDSLNVKVVLIEVFCEYSIPTNFISFISHFIKSDNDFQNCVQFCEWALRRLQKDDMFVTKILFTDKATFTKNGQVNLRNMHY